MIDLTRTTFIIPVRLDSRDREFNILFLITHLVSNFKTNIIIKESDSEPRLREMLMRLYPEKVKEAVRGDDFGITIGECKLMYLYEQTDDTLFHRTRLLNEMLDLVYTPVVVNHDCDVFMLPEDYKLAETKIIDGLDVYYPYFRGESQVKVEVEDRKLLGDLDNLLFLAKQNGRMWGSQYGHMQFFATDVYRNGGMENEDFKSYGAEDVERFFRFCHLGYNVIHGNANIFHLEHARGHNSTSANPFFKHNEDLYREIMYLTPQNLKEYYSNRPYLSKYKK